MRYRLDASVTRPRRDVVVGGSPLRVFRLSAAGADLFDRLCAGEDLDLGPARSAVVDRFLDAGAVHPVPGDDPVAVGAPSVRDVTVVVPVRDRADSLDRLLASLDESCAPGERPAEVVVVDDGSIDAAAHAEVARGRGARLVRRGEPGGPGVARDYGIRSARTPVVAVVDSDCTVTPRWLDRCLAHLFDRRVAAVAPRVRARAGGRPIDDFDAVRSPLDLGDVPGRVAPRTRIAYVPSAALVLRVDAYEAVGGFDPELLTGEDVDLVWRLVESRWRVRYEPAAEVHHDVRADLRSWVAQRVAYGASAADLDARHPGAVAPVSCSPWSAAVWALAAGGHPVAGAAIAAGSAAMLPRRLPQVPADVAIRLAATGHLGAGRLLARAVVRAWWPLALVAASRSKLARRILAASAARVVTDALAERARSSGGDTAGRERAGRDRAGTATFAALALLDDTAYGAGLWLGCIRRRSFRALLPDLGTPRPTPVGTGPPDARSAETG